MNEKKRRSKSQIAAHYRKKNPEQFKRASQTLNAFRDNAEEGVSTAPQRDHKAPELRNNIQQTAPAPVPAAAPCLPPTENVKEKKDLTSPKELKDNIKEEILEKPEQKEAIGEADVVPVATATAGKVKNDDDAKENNELIASPFDSVKEETEDLAPIYSSDKDEVKYAEEDTVVKPRLIALLPLPQPALPAIVHQQQGENLKVEAAVSPMQIDQLPAVLASPTIKKSSPQVGTKRRNAPQHSSCSCGASKPPLKMIKAKEYVYRKPSVTSALNIPAVPLKLEIPDCSKLVSGGGPAEHLGGIPLLSPPKKPSCLADAVTAAQMVPHGDMKPNQYALRPLPPAPPLVAAAQVQPTSAAAAAAAATTGASEEYLSLNIETQPISLNISGDKNDSGKNIAANGITQMAESEPQEEVTVAVAVAVAVAAVPEAAAAVVVGTGLLPEGVRRAQDLVFNRNNETPVNDVLDRPGSATGGPHLPAPLALPAAEAEAAIAPVPVNAAPQNPMSTPLDAAQNPLPHSTAALAPPPSAAGPPAAAVGNNPPAPTPLARTPYSTTRPVGSRQPTTTSPAPVNLDRYLSGPLLEAMMKHGGVPAKIYQWQADCLAADGGRILDNDRNLVYSAPTSAGKTLVAEILLLRALAKYPGRKTMLVLPYRALCHEKATRLAPLLKPLNKEVREYHGGLYSPNLDEHTTGIIVATIENANSILNRHLEDGSTPIQDEFSCIVTDELHLLKDPGRGYLLELLLTKLRYQAKSTEEKLKAAAEAKAAAAAGERDTAVPASVGNHQQQPVEGEAPNTGANTSNNDGDATTTPFRTVSTTTGTSIGDTARRIQIIGMSATLPNIKQIGKWLDATVYISEHRPIPLTQYLKSGREMLTLPTVVGKVAGEQEVREGDPAAVAAAGPAQLVSARQLPPATENDSDHVAHLTRETVDDGHSVLIFCGYKNACLWEAKRLAKLINVPVRANPMAVHKAAAANDQSTRPLSLVEESDNDDDEDDEDFLPVFEYTREAVAEALEALPMWQSKEHAALVRKGIAYHNSGLTKEEKKLIEGAYRSGAVSVLCATSTLAAGVNLPARRVIFLHGYKGMDKPENYLTVMEYHQMAGRAGRAGIDEFGESILIHCRKSKVPKSYFERLIQNDPERIESCLVSNGAMMMHAMLDVISSGTATTPKEVALYVNSFLISSDADEDTRKKVITASKQALQELGTHQGPKSEVEDRRLVVWDNDRGRFAATAFGKAATYSGLAPETAVKVMVDLAKARKSFVMDSELYSCYVCVPVHSDFLMKPQHWRHLRKIIDHIQSKKKPHRKKHAAGQQRGADTADIEEEVEDPADWKAAHNIGVFDYYYYIFQKAQDFGKYSAEPTTAKDMKIEHILRKFYIACILHQLVSERSKEDVAKEFYLDSARFIEDLQENTWLFAKKCREFCRNVQWFQLAAVLDEFGSRIKHGAKREILALSKIKGVKPPIARLLFQAGLRNMEEVANSDKKKIMKALAKGNAYQRFDKKIAEGMIRSKAEQILTSAKHLLKGGGGNGALVYDIVDNSAPPSLENGDALKKVIEIIRGGGVGHQVGGEKVDPHNVPAKRLEQQKEKEKDSEPEVIIPDGHTEEWEALEAVNRAAPAQPPATADAAVPAPAAAVENVCAGAIGSGARNNAADRSNVNKQEEGQQEEEEPLPPSPFPLPDLYNNSNGGGGGNGGAEDGDEGSSKRPAPSAKSLPTGLFLINTAERLDRFIRILSKLSIFGAQFITVPHKRAMSSPIAQLAAQNAAVAAMAPPSKIKKKEGNKDKKSGASTSKAVLYDADLDSGDLQAQKNAGPKPGTVLGIAISWGPGAAAYVPLHGKTADGTEWQRWDIAARKIADVILASDVEVVWFGWKKQVESTRWLLVQASSSAPSSSPAAAGAGADPSTRLPNKRGAQGEEKERKNGQVSRTGADLHRYMTDARIAMWVYQPDSGTVHDGILTEDDINSRLISSDGKRKRGEDKKVFGASVLLNSICRGDKTVVESALNGLTEDDKKRPMGSQALAACQTAAIALQLRNAAMAKVEAFNDPALINAFREYEMPLVPVLADMERAGAGFSIEKLNKMLPRMKRRLVELHTLAHEAAGPGPDFSMTSNSDIRNVLYSRLQLPVPHGAELKGTKKDGTSYTTYSTGRQHLLMLMDAHPIVPMIIEHRKLTHTIGRVRDMLELAKAEKAAAVALAKDEKFTKAAGAGGAGGGDKSHKTHGVAVHCPFIHTGTATGRLAMEGFNLQNLTKPYAFKALLSQPKPTTDTTGGGAAADGGEGRKHFVINPGSEDIDLTQGGSHMHLEANLRSAIVPSKPGRVIMGADFRQIEFRLMAHFSGDPVVRSMLADGAEDPFKLVAARWKKLPIDQVSNKTRDDAKQIVYALFYGMGAGAMADKMDVSPKRAQQMKDEFLDTYSGIKQWIEQVKIDCAEKGYITTLAGRRRWIPEIRSIDWQAKSSGERKAVNSICQGSAADVAKKAMISICREFEVQNLKCHVDMVLQIHDELVFEVDVEYQEQVAQIVKQCMEGAAVLNIPLRAKLESGPSWGEMTRLN